SFIASWILRSARCSDAVSRNLAYSHLIVQPRVNPARGRMMVHTQYGIAFPLPLISGFKEKPLLS
ncbi:MAG: hypothetical protein LBU85_02715, partial [Treponema sp.]|nr:hypothetical protein [Treponema sp.]